MPCISDPLDEDEEAQRVVDRLVKRMAEEDPEATEVEAEAVGDTSDDDDEDDLQPLQASLVLEVVSRDADGCASVKVSSTC
jgi:hypothetical protein